MNYDEASEQIKVAGRHFAAFDYRAEVVGGLHNPEALAEFLLEKDEENHSILDEAISQFAKKESWPELTRLQSLLIYVRVRHALIFLKQLSFYIDGHVMAMPSDKTPRQVLVRWLLIFVWKDYREVWMPKAARQLLGDFR